MFLDLNQPKHAHVDARLRAESILWLGTVRPDGRPHLVPVWFLWDGESISIYSQPDAQKLRNLAANPAVTVALEALGEGSDVVIIEGEARVGAAADVPAGNAYCPAVHYIWARSITAGCTTTAFCPGSRATRGQTAVFLLKAFSLELYAP